MKVCKCCQRVFSSEADFLTTTSRWRMGSNRWLYFNCSCNSTLVLKDGHFDWFTPEKLLSPEARSIFTQLSHKEHIPKIPETVVNLQETVKNPESTTEHIVQQLNLEPILAIDVLQIANLSRPSQDSEIRTLEHAVVYIGRRHLADLILTASIRGFSFKSKRYTRDIFWTEAFMTGAIAEALASQVIAKTNLKIELTPDEIYLGACLCNIGKVIAAICAPEMLDQVYDTSRQQFLPWVTAEQKTKCISHIALGEIATAFWGLPNFVLQACSLHHSGAGKQDFMEDNTNYAAIVVVANQLMHMLLDQSDRMEQQLLIDNFEFLFGKNLSFDDFLGTLGPIRERVLAQTTESTQKRAG